MTLYAGGLDLHSSRVREMLGRTVRFRLTAGHGGIVEFDAMVTHATPASSASHLCGTSALVLREPGGREHFVEFRPPREPSTEAEVVTYSVYERRVPVA